MDNLEWYWTLKVRPKLNFVLALVTGAIAVVIIFSECTLPFTGTFGIFIYTWIVRPIVGDNYTLSMVNSEANVQMFLLFLLGFVCFLTFYGIFNFKVSGFYGLYPYHQTDPSNLVYSALYGSATQVCVGT